MVKFKNIRIKKPSGGSRLQRVQVLSSGKFKFVKNIKRKRAVKKNVGKRKGTRRKSGRRATKKRRPSRRAAGGLMS